jgi:alpha-beta hydrolase superfamily lysophospholipase
MQFEQINYSSEQFSGTQGYLRWWKNSYSLEIPPRGWVVIVHGMAEHGGRYDEIAQYFCRLGFDVLVPDLPGYGLSYHLGGQQAVYGVEEMTLELRKLVEHFVLRGPLASKGIFRSPWFLMGHSLGALLVLNWLVEGKKTGERVEFAKRAFVSAPPLGLSMKIPDWKKGFVNILLRTYPHLNISSGLGAESLTFDGVVRSVFRRDPFIRRLTSPMQLASIHHCAQKIRDHCRDIEIPLMVAVGDADPIVDARSVEDFYKKLGTHKKFMSIPGARHEILNELDRSSLYRGIAEWFLS